MSTQLPAAAGETKPEKQPLRPQRVFQSVQDVQDEMANEHGQIEAFYRQAESQGRGLSAAETESINEHMEYYAFLEKQELPRMEKFEDMKRDAVRRAVVGKTAAYRGSSSVLTAGPGGVAYEVAGMPRVVRPDLMAFRPHLFSGGYEGAVQAARDAGHWLRAYLFRHPESIQY
ncbi:MAG: hypothetical protein OEN50_17645, partial [Deltaproteobacteria bacterium]|nr:hypothetical protein [Deltaproteobacteria bacterium]